MYEMSVGFSLGINSARSDSKTEINVEYFGANDENWITGLSMSNLKQAIVDFPENCAGNVADYILWPYDNLLTYQKVVSDVRLAKSMDVPLTSDPFSIEDSDATSLTILSSLFTEAMIEIMIIENSLTKLTTYSSSEETYREQIIFDFKLYGMSLNDHYKAYLEILEQEDTTSYKQISIL
jgi:hypothetical protein